MYYGANDMYYARVQLNGRTFADEFSSESECSDFCRRFNYSYKLISEAEWRIEQMERIYDHKKELSDCERSYLIERLRWHSK